MKTKTFLSCILMLISFLLSDAVQAQTKETFNMQIWQGTGNTDSDAKDAILYGYIPEESNGKAVVICPGGGYRSLSMDYEGKDFGKWFNERGVAAFVLSYRLPGGRYTVPQADAEQAIRLVRNNASKWGVDTKAVGIMGSSAGGHLAATTSTLFSSTAVRPDFQILLYPVITMNSSYTHAGSRNNLLGTSPSADLVNKYSCEKNVKTNTPQAFIVVSSADTTVPVYNSLQYTQAMIDKGLPVSLHVYPGGYHGFGHKSDFKDYDIWHHELSNWLEQIPSSAPEPEEERVPLADYDVDYDGGLLLMAFQLTDNCHWEYDGYDMGTSTLIDGMTSSYFHSDKSNTTPLSNAEQYIQMNMRFKQEVVQLHFRARDLMPSTPFPNPTSSVVNTPRHIVIKASNTPSDETSWLQVAEFTDGFPGIKPGASYYSPAIVLPSPMRYIRMYVKAAEQSNYYWNISELQLYPCKAKNPDSVRQTSVDVEDQPSAVYSLSGQHVGESQEVLPTGIYVRGGRKVAVK